MKKILAVLVSALLMLSCTVTAFAETDPATPDEPDTGELARRYEVISVKNSPKVYTEADVTLVDYPIYDYDDDYLFEGNYKLKVDLEGVEVTFKDTCTSKTYTKVFDGTEPCQIKQIYIIDPDEPNQVFTTYVSTRPEYWMDVEPFDNVNEALFFTISVNYKTSEIVVSTNDTATKDTATKDTATMDVPTIPVTGKFSTDAVQTGNPMTAVAIAFVMAVASGAMFVCYRRKVEK